MLQAARIALLGLAVLALSPASATAQEVRACWLTQYTYLGQDEAGLRAIAQNILSGGMNTVYLNVYGNGGRTYWPSKAYAEAGGPWESPTFDWTRYLIDVFRSEGLRVGAWFEYGFALLDENHPIAVAHPEWLARDQNGDPVTGENGGFVFLSPGAPGAVALIRDMVTELAANYDFDDIQIDRIRWGRKSTGREYGYEAVTAAAYQAQFGSSPPNNVNNSNWVNFRVGLVDQAFETFYDAVKAANPRVVVSAVPVGSYGWTQHMQVWANWLAGGYVDFVMPQMYLTSLPSFINEFNAQLAAAGANADKLGVAFRAQEDDDWQLVRDQMEYARNQGVLHGGLWVYHTYTSQIAIQDEIDNLAQPGRPWALPANNPFVEQCKSQLFVDQESGLPAYQELGPSWIDSAQPDYFGFSSRVVPGSSQASSEFSFELARSGAYRVSVWHTASPNRNPQARVTILHADGESEQLVDQRVDGGQWIDLGVHPFAVGPLQPRVRISNDLAGASQFTSSDAVRLALVTCEDVNGTPGCFGNGGVTLGCTDCPCGNEAAPDVLGGCLNSNGRSALLYGSGSPSVASDELRFEALGANSTTFGVLLSGPVRLPNNSNNPCFGLGSGVISSALDGLRCVGGSTQRHGARPTNSVGDIGITTNGWGPPNGPAGGLIAHGGFAAGETRHFQVFYREEPTLGCWTGQNTSNSVSYTFLP